jgi:CRP-like cAMP-binding protein
VAATIPSVVVNRILASLPPAERRRLLACCEPVELHFGSTLCEAGEPYRHVYFPLTSFISLLQPLSDHPPLETALIGDEGMLGATLLLGVNDAPLLALVQGSGTALRMTASQLHAALPDSPRLLRALSRYLYVTMAQLSQTTGCMRFHEIEERLARWLLMTHDRAHADHFHLTHDFLADMLGVRRSGITVAAGALQRRRLIRYTRGEIRIIDRPGLEAASCECYAAVIDDYDRLLA